MTTHDSVSATEAATRPTYRGITLSRTTTTELRRMFDTRSGFRLMASIGVLALLATARSLWQRR